MDVIEMNGLLKKFSIFYPLKNSVKLDFPGKMTTNAKIIEKKLYFDINLHLMNVFTEFCSVYSFDQWVMCIVHVRKMEEENKG